MKTMKWLMMCMLAISACCLSACGDDDESISPSILIIPCNFHLLAKENPIISTEQKHRSRSRTAIKKSWK